jgi:hypothetical protein
MKMKEFFVTRYTLLWSGNHMEVLVLQHAPASLRLTGFDGQASIKGIAKFFSLLPLTENDQSFHPAVVIAPFVRMK